MTDRPVPCDVSWLQCPDLAAVDALARLQLSARRRGQPICLVHAAAELVELLELCGLGDVLPVDGKTEEGEQIGGEEGVDAGDAGG